MPEVEASVPAPDPASSPAPAEEDEYSNVCRGRLSLKGSGGGKKKKDRRARPSAIPPPPPPEVRHKQSELKRTPAEIAFQKMQEKMQKERIASKASMTHKQRVEMFNQHLDSLTEHFDIPKVSWTK